MVKGRASCGVDSNTDHTTKQNIPSDTGRTAFGKLGVHLHCLTLIAGLRCRDGELLFAGNFDRTGSRFAVVIERCGHSRVSWCVVDHNILSGATDRRGATSQALCANEECRSKNQFVH